MTPTAPQPANTISPTVPQTVIKNVRNARNDVCHRTLLDPEEGRQLLVVHLSPKSDSADTNEHNLDAAEQVRDVRCCNLDDDESHRRARHREPERRTEDTRARRTLGDIEVKAEERGRHACTKDDRQHRTRGDEGLHAPIRAGPR
jgi:hypothetical protein